MQPLRKRRDYGAEDMEKEIARRLVKMAKELTAIDKKKITFFEKKPGKSNFQIWLIGGENLDNSLETEKFIIKWLKRKHKDLVPGRRGDRLSDKIINLHFVPGALGGWRIEVRIKSTSGPRFD